jgi:predicted nucleic acid-binding protein
MLVVSAIARAEVPSALWRKARTGELEDAAASILVSAFELDFHGDPDSDPRFTILSLTEPVLIAAAREAGRHALCAYDAVQLASALAVREIDPRCIFDVNVNGIVWGITISVRVNNQGAAGGMHFIGAGADFQFDL